MATTFNDGKEILTNTIQKNLRHGDYEHVCEIAKKYTAYVTGGGAEALLKRFVPREDEEAFKQRVEITKLITPYIANRIMTPMFKAPRVTAAVSFNWEKKDKASENLKRLQENLSKYYGETSVQDYLAYRMVELDCTDPNTFIVTEIEGEARPEDPTSKVKPYPFEVNSYEAIDYKYINNELQYLTVMIKRSEMKRYTIYLENDWIKAQQITEQEYKKMEAEGSREEILFKDPEKKSADEIYVITTDKHNAKRVPAVRVGCKRDLTTRGRTRVPMMHPAECFFEKSIKTISECDLTLSLHTFPQKWIYDAVCPGDLKNNVHCDNGYLPNKEKCPICKGSGFAEHKSAQDVIRVKMPADLKEIAPLEHFSAYKHPPGEILEFLKKLSLYEIPELAIQAVYTTELFSKDTVTETATEKNIDLESVYDAIKPFTDKWSNVFKHITRVIAAHTNVSEGFSVEHKFPKDFKMKPVSQLLEDLSKASKSGAPSYVIKEINRDIADKLYVDKPDERLKIQVKEKFFPFNGKTEGEIATIMTDGLVSKFNKILYANYDLIFDELEEENSSDEVSFWKMEAKAQRDLLKKKVEIYLTGIEEEHAEARAQSFGTITGEEKKPDGEEDNNGASKEEEEEETEV